MRRLVQRRSSPLLLGTTQRVLLPKPSLHIQSNSNLILPLYSHQSKTFLSSHRTWQRRLYASATTNPAPATNLTITQPNQKGTESTQEPRKKIQEEGVKEEAEPKPVVYVGQLRPKLELHYTCSVCDYQGSKAVPKKRYDKGLVIIRCDYCHNLHLLSDHLDLFEAGEKTNIEEILAQRTEVPPHPFEKDAHTISKVSYHGKEVVIEENKGVITVTPPESQ
jgi:hypothetical protein